MSAEPTFDMTTLFRPQYDFEPLRQILVYLLKQDKEIKAALARVNPSFRHPPAPIPALKPAVLLSQPAPIPSPADPDRLGRLESWLRQHDDRLAQIEAILAGSGPEAPTKVTSVSEPPLAYNSSATAVVSTPEPALAINKREDKEPAATAPAILPYYSGVIIVARRRALLKSTT